LTSRSSPSNHRRTFLIISQVYVPDPAAVGQYVAEAATELARRGNRVIVLTSNRGYDDTSLRYPAREVLRGVEIVRLPFSSLGKSSMAIRLVGALLFLVQAVLRSMTLRGVDGILVTTSPPMSAGAGVLASWIHRAPLTYWIMDLNPDQMIALGLVSKDSVVARVFDWINRLVLNRAAAVVVLDRFMAERVFRKRDVRRKTTVIPPWPLEQHRGDPSRDGSSFRQANGWTDRFVVMYSGNLTPSNPVDTVLEAAKRLVGDPRIVFALVGGGAGKQAASGSGPSNVVSLPYQPLERLTETLSAADMHLVSLGEKLAGIVHPSKVYGAMAVVRPILYLGPAPSHISELLNKADFGWWVAHGDVDGAESAIRQAANAPPAALAAMGRAGRELLRTAVNADLLRDQFCELVEETVAQVDNKIHRPRSVNAPPQPVAGPERTD